MSEAQPPFSTSLIPHLVRVELVREGPWPTGEPITMPGEVYALLQDRAAKWDREHFLTVLLDASHRVVGIDLIAIGPTDACPVHPRETFKSAILANASAIIAVHNHPSGSLTPSPEDRAATKKLAEAGTLLGIPLLDHLIITGTSYYSFKDAGLL